MNPDWGSFEIGRLPRIHFGAGSADRLPVLAGTYGSRWLLVTGGRSFDASAKARRLETMLKATNASIIRLRISGEPSPEEIDAAVCECRSFSPEVVLGIGGGSVLDAAKAIAGLLSSGHSVMNYLEGVGPEWAYAGESVPLIAVPTTAGTGSEATRNAVLTRHGPDGFKKSFRADALVAREAVVDPEFLLTCPPSMIAANGMDALTQLIESYLSIRANPMTDGLALSGIAAIAEGLEPCFEAIGNAEARSRMAYASLISGICLAQAGLGSVHALAQPLGAFYRIPHGEACGSVLAAATAVNIKVALGRQSTPAVIQKYAAVSRLLLKMPNLEARAAVKALPEKLLELRGRLKIPCLRAFGVTDDALDAFVRGARNSTLRNNPVELEDGDLREILSQCL